MYKYLQQDLRGGMLEVVVMLFWKSLLSCRLARPVNHVFGGGEGDLLWKRQT